MVKQNIGTSDSISPSFTPHPCSAAQMGCSQRKNLSVHAIRRTEPVTHLAQRGRSGPYVGLRQKWWRRRQGNSFLQVIYRRTGHRYLSSGYAAVWNWWNNGHSSIMWREKCALSSA